MRRLIGITQADHHAIGRAQRRDRRQHEAGDAAGYERRDRDRRDVRAAFAVTESPPDDPADNSYFRLFAAWIFCGKP